MVDFISEVQEELRKDDYNKWLRRYGPYAIGGIILVIAAAGVMEWRKASAQKAATITSSAYLQAMTDASEGNTSEAINEFEAIAQTAPSGYQGLAFMQTAALEVDRGDVEAALTKLDQAAEAFDKPRHKQLAQIKALYILAGEGRYSEVIERATPLAENGQPYEFLAREILGFAAQQSGDISKARAQYSYLDRTPGVPESIQSRAAQHLGLMRDANVQPPTETPPANVTDVKQETAETTLDDLPNDDTSANIQDGDE